jgi:membrane protein YqaA with SNARE-associated domain
MLAKLTAILIAYGPWGVMLLAFIDSAGIPVATGMDALIIVVAAQAPWRAWLAASLGVIGSVIGNLVLFLGVRLGFSRFVKAPGPGEKQRFREWFQRYGLLTVFIPALLPIPLPLKPFLACAAVLGTPLRSFLLVIVLARILRYFGEAYLGAKLGREPIHFLRTHTWPLLGGAVVLFLVLYALLVLTERRRRRAGATAAPRA